MWKWIADRLKRQPTVATLVPLGVMVIVTIVANLITPSVSVFQEKGFWWGVGVTTVLAVSVIIVFSAYIRHLNRRLLDLEGANKAAKDGRGQPSTDDLQVSIESISTVKKRELVAETVWIMTPTLHYDIHNKDFRDVILANKKRNAVYCYIVPEGTDMTKNIDAYKKIYSHSDEEIDSLFARIESTKLCKFLNEIVIYDAGTKNEYGYAIPPSSRKMTEDVLRFEPTLVVQYINDFADVWRSEKKGAEPPRFTS